MNSIFTKTQAIWQNLLAQDTNILPLPQLFEQLAYLRLAEASHSVISIFNIKEFKNDYISKNVEDILGYKSGVNDASSTAHFYRNFAPEHASFPLISTQLQNKAFDNISTEDRQQVHVTGCGMRFRHAKKGWIRILLQVINLEMSNDQIPLRSLLIIQDITHLLKEDAYWIRIDCGEEKIGINGYFSQNQETISGDIISKREKEILTLIIQGKTTPEIAAQLFISTNTVNNHRQNLLNKLGAKDTTALIHLAQITNLT